MSLSREEVAHLGRLARLELTDAEIANYAEQMNVILESISAITEVGASDVPAMSHPVPMTNVFRPDVVTNGVDRDEVLAAAPAHEDDRFRVPRILDEEA